MNEIFVLFEAYEQELLLVLIGATLIVSIISLHKIKITKKRLEQVIATVSDYLSTVYEEEKAENSPKVGDVSKKDLTNAAKVEEQSRLISAVLQEIFP